MRALNFLILAFGMTLSFAAAGGEESAILKLFVTATKSGDEAVDIMKAAREGQMFQVGKSDYLALMARAVNVKRPVRPSAWGRVPTTGARNELTPFDTLSIRLAQPNPELEGLIRRGIRQAMEDLPGDIRQTEEVGADGATIFHFKKVEFTASAERNAQTIISAIRHVVNDPDNLLRGSSGL